MMIMMGVHWDRTVWDFGCCCLRVAQEPDTSMSEGKFCIILNWWRCFGGQHSYISMQLVSFFLVSAVVYLINCIVHHNLRFIRTIAISFAKLSSHFVMVHVMSQNLSPIVFFSVGIDMISMFYSFYFISNVYF